MGNGEGTRAFNWLILPSEALHSHVVSVVPAFLDGVNKGVRACRYMAVARKLITQSESALASLPAQSRDARRVGRPTHYA